MGEFRVRVKTKFTKTEKFLNNVLRIIHKSTLDKYGKIGVESLREWTPKDTGLTSESWYYQIEKTKDGYKLIWRNTNIQDGVNVALILQTGHATSRGYWIEGRDYINPALQLVFDQLAEDLWKEVKNA